MRVPIAILLAVMLASAAGCTRQAVHTKPTGPKIEEYPAPPIPERIHGGII